VGLPTRSYSAIEDTLVFMALGANGWVLISVRFLLAALAAFAVSLLIRLKPATVKIER